MIVEIGINMNTIDQDIEAFRKTYEWAKAGYELTKDNNFKRHMDKAAEELLKLGFYDTRSD